MSSEEKNCNGTDREKDRSMVFSSLVFLWIFLPIIIIGYYIVDKRYKNIFLLLGSLIFYAWGEPIYIFLMLFSIIINWGIGLLIERFASYKQILLVADILLNIGILGYFKYFNFAVDTVNYIFRLNIETNAIKLPIGISFFTFQILSYMIDLYRGKYKAQKNIINLALYISFFPQLIAGPIVRYQDINEQLLCRSNTFEKTAEGIRRFIYGLGKKVIIANTVAECTDYIYGLEYMELTGVLAWAAAILYTLQIYYDFSGYSDMAIGLGKIFGFEFHENFNYPYLSCSIQEFWQRWHISLGEWFKEYLYIPLGGNRKGKARTYINLVIVFLATGLWHGASFNFILWGLFHGTFSIFERAGFRKTLDRHTIFSHIYTLAIVVFGWVLFRAENLIQAGVFVRRMLLPWEYTKTSVNFHDLFGNKTVFIILLGVAGIGATQVVLQKMKITGKLKNSGYEMIYCSSILIICLAMLASNLYNPFIYFRF